MRLKPLKSICLLLLISLSLLLLAQGCTYRAWYESFKERERMECYKHLNNSDVETCLERVNSMSYDEYQDSKIKY